MCWFTKPLESIMGIVLFDWIRKRTQEVPRKRYQKCPFCGRTYESYRITDMGRLRVTYACGTKITWGHRYAHKYKRSYDCKARYLVGHYLVNINPK